MQRLWMKLMKKYKFKRYEWELLSPSQNLHYYLLDESCCGLQKLIRFYHKRHLLLWREDAFEYGLELLVDNKQCLKLEMYFLNSLICEDWEIHYLKNKTVVKHFLASTNKKVIELLERYQTFKKNPTTESAFFLYRLIMQYNPQYKINSKSLPSLVKQLVAFQK